MFTIKTFNGVGHDACDQEAFRTDRYVFEAENYLLCPSKDGRRAIVKFQETNSDKEINCIVGKDERIWRIIIENSAGVNVEHVKAIGDWVQY